MGEGNKLIKVDSIPTVNDLESLRFERQPLVRATKGSIRSDEEPTLEKSGFHIFHDGNSAFINSFDKTKVSCCSRDEVDSKPQYGIENTALWAVPWYHKNRRS